MRSRDRNGLPKLPRCRHRSIKIARGAVEIAISVALGAICVAAAAAATTSSSMRLLIAITAIVAVVLAEWGVRHAIHKGHGGNQPNRTPRRSRRG